MEAAARPGMGVPEGVGDLARLKHFVRFPPEELRRSSTCTAQGVTTESESRSSALNYSSETGKEERSQSYIEGQNRSKSFVSKSLSSNYNGPVSRSRPGRDTLESNPRALPPGPPPPEAPPPPEYLVMRRRSVEAAGPVAHHAVRGSRFDTSSVSRPSTTSGPASPAPRASGGSSELSRGGSDYSASVMQSPSPRKHQPLSRMGSTAAAAAPQLAIGSITGSPRSPPRCVSGTGATVELQVTPALAPPSPRIPEKISEDKVDYVRRSTVHIKIKSDLEREAKLVEVEEHLMSPHGGTKLYKQVLEERKKSGKPQRMPRLPSSPALFVTPVKDGGDRSRVSLAPTPVGGTLALARAATTHDAPLQSGPVSSALRERKSDLESRHQRVRTQPVGQRSMLSLQRFCELTERKQELETVRVYNSLAGDQNSKMTVADIKGMGLFQHFQNDIMISYCRRDIKFVKRLVVALQQVDIDPWVDWKRIGPGDPDWAKCIDAEIQQAYAVIAVLTPSFFESKFCKHEIDFAAQHGKLLVPVVYKDVKYEDVWPRLAKVNWIFMRATEFDVGFDKLLHALHIDYDYVQRHAELCRKALEYKKCGLPDLLLRGEALKNAKLFLIEGASKHPNPIAEQIDFIDASKVAWKKEKRARRILYFGGMLLLLTLLAMVPTVLLLMRSGSSC